MKSYRINFLLASLFAVFLTACSGAFVNEPAPIFETFPSQFLIGDTYILKNHQKIDGNIAGIGTTLIIEDGALVMGDISLVGGNLEISGRVAGDVNVFAGTSNVENTAIITGNINQIFQKVNVEPNALVSGEINTYVFPTAAGRNTGEGIVSILEWLRPVRILYVKLAQILALVFVTILTIYLFKLPTLKVSNAIRCNLPAAWGAGLLSYIAAPIISIVFIITICLSPVGLIMLLAFLLSIIWGWVALSSIAGGKITEWLKLDWDDEPSAILGAFVIGIATSLISIIPCIGFLINLVIASFGLGGVLLSRFGTCKE